MEILVLFDSKGGHVYELARSIAEGISEVEGMQVRIRRVKETTPLDVIHGNEEWSKFYDFKMKEIPEAVLSDLDETDGLAMGCPTRYGNVTPALGNFLESCGSLWVTGALVNKVAGVFSSSGTMHGGNETTLISMMFPLMHLGYVIVPMGYTHPGVMETDLGGTPYGPTSVSNKEKEGALISETEAAIARAFGKRLAEITKKVRS